VASSWRRRRRSRLRRFSLCLPEGGARERSERRVTELDIVHLRSTFILGPNAAPFLRRYALQRIYVAPRQPHPRIQVVHEEDVATAIIHSLNPQVRAGVFNIAASGNDDSTDLIKNGRSLVLRYPDRCLRPTDRAPRRRMGRAAGRCGA